MKYLHKFNESIDSKILTQKDFDKIENILIDWLDKDSLIFQEVVNKDPAGPYEVENSILKREPIQIVAVVDLLNSSDKRFDNWDRPSYFYKNISDIGVSDLEEFIRQLGIEKQVIQRTPTNELQYSNLRLTDYLPFNYRKKISDKNDIENLFSSKDIAEGNNNAPLLNYLDKYCNIKNQLLELLNSIKAFNHYGLNVLTSERRYSDESLYAKNRGIVYEYPNTIELYLDCRGGAEFNKMGITCHVKFKIEKMI